jgi:hypothetical protein
MSHIIKWSHQFTSFHTVRNNHELEEIELDHSVAQGQASAFYSALSGGGRPPHPPPHEPLCPQAAPPLPTTTLTAVAKAIVRAKEKERQEQWLRQLQQQQRQQ